MQQIIKKHWNGVEFVTETLPNNSDALKSMLQCCKISCGNCTEFWDILNEHWWLWKLIHLCDTGKMCSRLRQFSTGMISWKLTACTTLGVACQPTWLLVNVPHSQSIHACTLRTTGSMTVGVFIKCVGWIAASSKVRKCNHGVTLCSRSYLFRIDGFTKDCSRLAPISHSGRTSLHIDQQSEDSTSSDPLLLIIPW